MAEQEPVAAKAQEEDDDETTPGYKPPAQKSLSEIVSQDNDDESLVRYKKALLGEGECAGDKKEVKVKKLSIIVEGRDPVEMDLTVPPEERKKFKIVLKEGCEYKVQITFSVKGEIVTGLRYFQNTSRKGIRVHKESFMVGSYGPKAEDYQFLTPVDEAPSGMIARGEYNIKSKFTDDDKNSYLEWEWTLIIKKDFE